MMPVQQTDAATPSRQETVSIRPLAAADLDAVVAIDKAVSGRPRRGFFEKRLAHLVREPAAFVALAAEREGRLVGFVFARLYRGEFGGDVAEATVDAIGVATEAQRQGVGRRLMDAMAATMRSHGIKEIVTQADWTETNLTAFFGAMKFSLAPRIVLERPVVAANAD
jgi:ribosomal protein S18 acetylase RimI-like enzyme